MVLINSLWAFTFGPTVNMMIVRKEGVNAQSHIIKYHIHCRTITVTMTVIAIQTFYKNEEDTISCVC